MIYILKSNVENDKYKKELESLKAALIKRLAEQEKKGVKKALIQFEKNYTYLKKSNTGKMKVVSGCPVGLHVFINLDEESVVMKGGKLAAIGEHRTWNGQEYVKIAPNKWKPYYAGNTRGAKLASAAIAKKIKNAKDIDELMQIVSQNMQRFGFSADGENDKLYQRLRDAQKEWAERQKTPSATPSTVATTKPGTKKVMLPKKMAVTGKTSKGDKAEALNAKSEIEQDKRLGKIATWEERIKNSKNLKDEFDKISKEYDEIKNNKKNKNDLEMINSEFNKIEKLYKDLDSNTSKNKYTDKLKTMDSWRDAEEMYENDKEFAAFVDQKADSGPHKDNFLHKQELTLNDLINEAKRTGNKEESKKNIGQKMADAEDEEYEKYEKDAQAKYGNMSIEELQKEAKKYDGVDKYSPEAEEARKVYDVLNEKLFQQKKNKQKEVEESEAEKHQNRSDAMKGNKNAYKGGPEEDESKNRMAQWEEAVDNKIKEYKNDWYTKASAESAMKKLGEKKLEAYAKLDIKSDEEFKSSLMKLINKHESDGDPLSDYTVGTAIWNHYYKVEAQKYAKEKLENMRKNAADSGDDIPVSEADMDEAKNIIGSDVRRILSGGDTFGNAKQTLTDKIRRRIRNQPGVARAMLKYIQEEQKRTGKVVYTPKHSIWQELPKLNENARQAQASGESETKTGTTGNLYEGEDGTTVVEDKDWGRYKISFPGKPDAGTISTLKHNGFRWSPSTKTWVGYNTANGERALQRVAEEIGLKKIESKPIVKPDAETNKNIEKEVEKKKTIDDIKKHYSTAKSITGNKKTYYLSNGEKIKCHYKLVEADTPTASHDENTYTPTPGFPTAGNGSTVNDRDYSKDVDAQESVRSIAANYGGQAIQDPPIVTKDGIVVSGNNRTMSSKLAAKNGTDKSYLEDLADQIEDFGFEEDDLKEFKHPRLILEVDEEHTGDYTTEEFAKYNKSGKKSMNTTEKAVKVAKTIKADTIKSMSETISEFDTLAQMWTDKKAAQSVVNSLVEGGIIDRNDVSQYYTEKDGISDTGKEFIETVMVGSIMNESNIRALAGSGGKEIRAKLIRGIIPLIENKGMGNEYSFNTELNKAVNIATTVMKDREHFPTVKDYLKQQDMFEDGPDAITSKLAEMLEGSTQKGFAETMKSLDAGLKPNASGEIDIFLGRCETRNEVMDRILNIKETIKKAINSVFNIFNK